jgi:Pirin C-terminal cupin domain
VSNLDPAPEAVSLRAGVVHAVDVLEARKAAIGDGTLGERLVMWWNFVARTAAEIEAARGAWATGKFGQVRGYDGKPLVAPPLPAGLPTLR